MISLSLWTENIISSLKTFSDLDFQIRVWIHGKGSEFSSMDEEICTLFDDFVFDDFLKLPEVLSGKKRSTSLDAIYKALNSVTNDVMTDKDITEEFLRSDFWQNIIKLAKEAKVELDKARKDWKERIVT